MVVKFACIVPAMVYLGLPENVSMVEIHVVRFGLKIRAGSVLYSSGNRLSLTNQSL